MTESTTWVALCLPCWRRVFGRGEAPQEGEPDRCVMCAQQTGHGVYVNYLAVLQEMAADDPNSLV